MNLWSVINGVFTTNGISFEIGAIILLALCSVLMGMQDWRISLISLLTGSATLLIMFFAMGMDITLITYILFVSIILMAFSLYATRHAGQMMPS